MGLFVKSAALLGLTSLIAIGSAVAQSAPAPKCLGDVNGDGAVDVHDMVVVLNSFGATGATYKANMYADLYVDGYINGADLAIVQSRMGQSCKTCPSDLTGDGTVGGADLAALLSSGDASGSTMVALLSDWGRSDCGASYVAPTKKTRRSALASQRPGKPTKAAKEAAAALAKTL